MGSNCKSNNFKKTNKQMLLGTFCVARDDRRTAQSFKMGNLRGMSRPVLCKGRSKTVDREPWLQSLVGLAEAPETTKCCSHLCIWQKKEENGE